MIPWTSLPHFNQVHRDKAIPITSCCYRRSLFVTATYEVPASAQDVAKIDQQQVNNTGADLPDKGAVEREHNSSMSIFFVLCVIACGILLIHLMLQTGFQYLPESIVVVVLGALIGMFINVLSEGNIANWKREEVFSPTAFFLVLLPPIIFESGYNLHKGGWQSDLPTKLFLMLWLQFQETFSRTLAQFWCLPSSGPLSRP